MSVIKKRITAFCDRNSTNPQADTFEHHITSKRKDSSELLADVVAAKIEDGNVKAAIRILCSEDKPSLPTVETLNLLKAKHPQASPDRNPFPDPKSLSVTALVVDESVVNGCIRSFPAGSAGGPDGFRPQHLLDLVNCKECGTELLSSITAFVNLLLSGTYHPDIIPYFLAAD